MLGHRVGIGLFQRGSSFEMVNLIRPRRLLMLEGDDFAPSLLTTPSVRAQPWVPNGLITSRTTSALRAPTPWWCQGHGSM